MKLFTGDTDGRVVCTEIDYTTVSYLLIVLAYFVLNQH